MSEMNLGFNPSEFPAYEAILDAPDSLRRAKRSVLIAFALLGVGLLTPWQQTASGTGRVSTLNPSDRQQTLDAPIEGRLVRWHVSEGSRVNAGDPIVELSDNDPEIVNRIRAEKSALEQRRAAARLSLQVARTNLGRQKELFAQGLASK